MQSDKETYRPKLLFVVTEHWYFLSHRLPLALAAIDKGFDVTVATRITDDVEIFRTAGITVCPWNISRGSTKIWTELRALYQLFRIFRKVKPDLVHQVSIKPVLYGSFIAKLVGPKRIVNALGGMGSIFNNSHLKTCWIKKVILTGFRWLLSSKSNVLILQNPDDRALMISKAGVAYDRIELVRGAGVNVVRFCPKPEPEGLPMVVLPARMLLDKGVGEFVEAARILKADGVNARFALVGGIDTSSPTGVTLEQLNRWTHEGDVEWLGMRTDMPEVFQQSNIVCLPSYGEGLPKALLEAAACGRAIVATDVPGCREIVIDDKNGLLVPPRDPVALAAALKKLIDEPETRGRMGTNGRKLVIDEFSEESVIKDTLDIYAMLLHRPS